MMDAVDHDVDERVDVDIEENRVRAVVRAIKCVKNNETGSSSEAPRQEEDNDEPNQGEARCGVWVHLVRVFRWRLAGLEPMSNEAQVLDKNDISNDALRACLVWRRSVPLVALPAIFFSAILAWFNLGTTCGDSKVVLNGFGDFICFIPSAASAVLLVVTVVVLLRWTRQGFCSRLAGPSRSSCPFYRQSFPLVFS